MKRGIAVVLAFLGLVSGALAQEPVKVKIALASANSSLYANVFLAQDLGYYAEEGLDVEITGYRGGGAAQQAVASGEGDMLCFFPAGVMRAVEKGIGQKIVGAQLNSPLGYSILVRADSGFQTMADLDGRTVGVSSVGSTSYFFALAAAAAVGITVEPVPVGGGYLPALMAGEVEAIVATASRNAQSADLVETRSVSDLGVLLPNSLPSVWVATDALIAEHPEAVEGVLRAAYRAILYMREHPEESVAYLMEFSVISDEALARQVYDLSIVPQSTTAWLDPAWIEAARDLYRLGGDGEPPAAGAFYTDRFATLAVE